MKMTYPRIRILFPVIVMVLGLLSACHKKDKDGITPARTHVMLALDAAHGGADTGTRNTSGKWEKNLALAVCQKIQAMAPGYNVEAVLTRRNDTDPSVEARVQQADAVKADIFISVHINKNFTGTQELVYEVFIAPDGAEPAGSRALTTAILSRLATAGKDTLRTDKNALILKNNARAAIAIECGDIDKAADVATMEDPEQLCRFLLEGVVAYSNSR